MLYAFFWVISRRLKIICRRFGTLFHLHRRIGVEWLCLRAISFTHTSSWPPCGSLLFTTCSVTGPTPTLSPSFLLAQAIFEPNFLTYGYPNIPKFSHSTSTCLWRWNRQCSETLAYKIQTPGNYPEEIIQNTVKVWNRERSLLHFWDMLHNHCVIFYKISFIS
jgi:hypothetical protein